VLAKNTSKPNGLVKYDETKRDSGMTQGGAQRESKGNPEKSTQEQNINSMRVCKKL